MRVETIGSAGWTRTSAAGRTAAGGDFAATLYAAMTGPDDVAPEAAAAAQAATAAFVANRPADPVDAASVAGEARQVSIAQGLPAGTYDFTRITPRQMTIVGGALIAEGAVRPAALAGALDLAAQAPAQDTPVNVFAWLRTQAAENEMRPGGMETAFHQRAAQAELTRVQQGQSGTPITYDDNYPGAPRAMTAEEATAKLKAAITAFTKEASLTPAQRIRRDVLKDMKLTEDQLKAMPEAEREATERRIGDEVLRRLKAMNLPATGARGAAAAEPDEDGAVLG